MYPLIYLYTIYYRKRWRAKSKKSRWIKTLLLFFFIHGGWVKIDKCKVFGCWTVFGIMWKVKQMYACIASICYMLSLSRSLYTFWRFCCCCCCCWAQGRYFSKVSFFFFLCVAGLFGLMEGFCNGTVGGYIRHSAIYASGGLVCCSFVYSSLPLYYKWDWSTQRINIAGTLVFLGAHIKD